MNTFRRVINNVLGANAKALTSASGLGALLAETHSHQSWIVMICTAVAGFVGQLAMQDRPKR